MQGYFDNPKTIRNTTFSKLCHAKLKGSCTAQWRSRLANEPKLRFYRLFKTEFQFENYLEIIPSYQLRKSITKFRCSDHKLEIETGRHRNKPINERICKMCNSEVETEEHFLRWCTMYKDLREKYFGQPSTFKHWVTILKCSDKKMTFNLVNYIKKALKIRNNQIQTICWMEWPSMSIGIYL